MLTARIFGKIALAGAFMFVPASLHASPQPQPQYGSMDAREHGYQHGYRDGLRQGRADMSRNLPYNYETEDYRRGDYGYEDYMGSHSDFQRGYRNGFKDGYEDGYYNRPIRDNIYGLDERYNPDLRREEDPDRYPHSGYTDVAFDNGYRDGLKAGQDDLRDRKDFKPARHDSYEDADHGYHARYGNKNAYKEQYRKGFMRGYEDAFHRARAY